MLDVKHIAKGIRNAGSANCDVRWAQAFANAVLCEAALSLSDLHSEYIDNGHTVSAEAIQACIDRVIGMQIDWEERIHA